MTKTQPLSIQPAELMDRLVEAERRLSDLHREVEHLHRLSTVGTLAAGVVHEINNALTPLLSYAQLASAAPGDEALARQVAQKAIAAVDRVTQITDAILGFVRPGGACDEGQGAQDADVAACLDEVFSCLAAPAGRDGVEVVIEVPLGCGVRMKPVALQQVVMNLVLNAREAMSAQGGGRLTIHAECSTWNSGGEESSGRAGQRVRLSVEDTGPGVCEAVRSRLFEPFVTSRGGEGNGLGLAVCRRLVTEAGGRIWCEPGEERGARFVLELFPA